MADNYTYHDLMINGRRISDLPFSVNVTCTRVGGWQVWNDDKLIHGEFENDGLVLQVGPVFLCGNELMLKGGDQCEPST